MRRFLSSFILLVFSYAIYAGLSHRQSPEDSVAVFSHQAALLHQQLNTAASDSLKIELRLQLGDVYEHSQPDSALFHYQYAACIARQAMERSPKNKEKYHILWLKTQRYLAILHEAQGHTEMALHHYENAIEAAGKLGHYFYFVNDHLRAGNVSYLSGRPGDALIHYEKGLSHLSLVPDSVYARFAARIHSSLGNARFTLGQPVLASAHYHESLRHFQLLGNPAEKINVLVGLGNIAVDVSEPDKAAGYYSEAMRIAESLHDEHSIQILLVNLGNVHFDRHVWSTALDYYNRALALAGELNDPAARVRAVNNIGMVYEQTHSFDKALNEYRKALDISDQNGFLQGMIHNRLNLASVLIRMQAYTQAEAYARKALELARDNELLSEQKNALRLLSRTREGRGDFRQALAYFSQFKVFDDSILNIESRKDLNRLESQFRFESLQQQLQLQNAEIEKQQLLSEQLNTRSQRNRRILLTSVFGLLASLVVIIFILQQQRKIKRTSSQLLSGMRYARSVQQALLVSPERISELFPSVFIYQQPKEILGGDFVWAGRQAEQHMLALADASGHGISAAFMSILGLSLMRSVNLSPGQGPENLIFSVEQKLREAFPEGGLTMEKANSSEMGILAFHPGSGRYRFAGTGIMLCLVSRGKNSLQFFNNKEECRQGTDLFPEPGDMLYLFSDGMTDLLGGKTGERYGRARLERWMLANFNLDLEDQKISLANEMSNWMGSLTQPDDMSLIGLRV